MASLFIGAMVMIIGCVSIYDVYWSFKTAEVLKETEQNPLGTWLISADGGDISLFMTCKMVGTMIVLMSIPSIYVYKKQWGMICGAAVATFQCLLMVYLNFGHLLNA